MNQRIEWRGAVTVSTFWRTLFRDSGRERANSRKSMAQKKVDANNIVAFARKQSAVAVA